MERDWSLSDACHGLQSHAALHNPGCAIRRIIAHVPLSGNNAWSPYYADRTLCQRLSMSMAQLGQARHTLITHHLLAYRRPLYQVLALEAQPPAEAADPEPHDDCVDLQAVFQQIWEVLS